MAQQTINIGSAPDDGTGDTIRVGGDKINDNFTELYTDYMPKAGGTFTGDIIVPDEAYDATAWNGNLEAPTKNAVRDKIESLGSGITELDDVPDVNAPTPSNGDILTWDSTPGEWVAAAPSSGIAELDDIPDVNAPTPANGDVLTWDSTPGEWVPAAPTGGSNALDDLTDVNAPTPTNGDVLTWDSTPGEWVATAPSGSTEWTLVDSDTASASANIDLSVDTSTFNEWLLIGHDVVLSGANELALQLGSGGGPTWDTGNNYDFGAEWRYGTTSTGTFSRAFVSATANMRLGTVSSASSASGVPLDFVCTLKYLASGKNARLINGQSSYDGGGGLTRLLFDGVHNNAAYTTTGLRILPSAGTITSGKFLLYGRTR